MTQSLLLDQDAWDLLTDINGNIAVADEPYRIAQDVATECRLFKGEYWYDTTAGIPYWQKILGKFPPLTLIKRTYKAAALQVVGVVSAVLFISSLQNRILKGQVQVTDKNNVKLVTSV